MTSVYLTGKTGLQIPGGRAGRREGVRQGGVLEERRRRDGGRNSLKSQREVGVAADRQIAAERARQIGKVTHVWAVKFREKLMKRKIKILGNFTGMLV